MEQILKEEKSRAKRLHKLLRRVIPHLKRMKASNKAVDHHACYKKEIRKDTNRAFKRAMRHRSASIRFARIRDGKKPFKVHEALLDILKPKPTAIARIKARHHDKIADKLATSHDGAKFARHDRAAKRYQRIADGKKPFGEEQK